MRRIRRARKHQASLPACRLQSLPTQPPASSSCLPAALL